MSLNKNSQAAKRRQKKAEKQRRKRQGRLARFKTRQGSEKPAIPDITDDEYVFWLCHGANYLASDETTGVWDPIFEDIYAGKLPEPQSIAQTVMTRYSAEIDAGGAFSGVPRAVLAWTVTDKSIIRVYKHEAERGLKKKDPDSDVEQDARLAHNPVVWALMTKVKQRLIQR